MASADEGFVFSLHLYPNLNVMYRRLKKLIVLVTFTVLIYSCTMANTNSVREPKFTNVNYNHMSIGDTLIFNPHIIATYRFSSNEGVNDRNIIYRDHSLLAQVTASGSGKIYINVCINQAGEPVFVSIDIEQTTIKDKKTLASALNMVAGYRFEKDEKADQYQCGMIKLLLDINAFKGIR